MKKHLLFILLVCFGTGSIAQSSNGLVAWYPLNGNANDSSGRNNNGTIYSGVSPTMDRFGNPNGAMHFDGTNVGYINCPNDTLLTKTKNLSFSIWFKVKNRASGWDQNIMISDIGPYMSSGGFQAYTVNPPGDYRTMYRNDSYLDQTLNGLTEIDSITWYNMVGVIKYDSLQDSTTVINYLNGTTEDSTKFGGVINFHNNSPFYIGTNSDEFVCCQRSFLGDMDDIKIWVRALSSSEVTGVSTNSTTINFFTEGPYLFPNPSVESFQVRGLAAGSPDAIIQVLNEIGQSVYAGTITPQGKAPVNLASITPGIYMVRIVSASQTHTLKWVKQ